MSTLPVSTIVNVSVAALQPGLLVPNVSNICILNKEVPAQPGNLTNLLGVYTSTEQVATDWGSGSEAYAQAVAIFGQKPNLLAANAVLMIYYMTSGVGTITQAITAVEGLAYAGAYLYAGYNPDAAEVEAGAAAANAIGSGKPLGCSSYLTSDLNAGGLFYTLSASDIPAGIMLLYTQAASYLGARIATAALFAAQMWTNFSGQNTTINVNVKTLYGITVDPGITPVILTQCQNLGVYVYASIQGVAKVIANGGPNNNFFDNVYNLNAFSNAVQIAVFNVLAQTPTKIPQTEDGMQMLKNAVLAVCQQFVVNGYIAPGTWNATDTFGNQSAFLRNIQQLGYYLYSAPIGAQSEAVRETRVAPVMQLAIKLAGAIDTASILIFINP
jgi:hypothetical protein